MPDEILEIQTVNPQPYGQPFWVQSLKAFKFADQNLPGSGTFGLSVGPFWSLKLLVPSDAHAEFHAEIAAVVHHYTDSDPTTAALPCTSPTQVHRQGERYPLPKTLTPYL